MPYQLLILTKDWFLSDISPGKFRVLSGILNKGYSKPMARYGIIQSPRIKDHDQFLDSLQLDSGCVSVDSDKDFAVFLLLGSKGDFKRLEAEFAYKRHFNSEIWPLTSANDSDIPIDLAREFGFGPLSRDTVEHVTLAPTDRLGPDIADRVLATIGVKTYTDDGHFRESDLSAGTKHYELTAFTSFMRGMGTELLGYVNSAFISTDKPTILRPAHVTRVVLHAVVIKEHDLVPYYSKVCGFVPSTHPDVVVSVSGTDSPLESGIEASQDFTISFLRRDLMVGK
ncbi:hypothetical protein OY671_005875 [Metschnikowia pulcherrima]|nr:hypothetical protein OY671_005875 [Metschnikowia pulcherrima]